MGGVCFSGWELLLSEAMLKPLRGICRLEQLIQICCQLVKWASCTKLGGGWCFSFHMSGKEFKARRPQKQEHTQQTLISLIVLILIVVYSLLLY